MFKFYDESLGETINELQPQITIKALSIKQTVDIDTITVINHDSVIQIIEFVSTAGILK